MKATDEEIGWVIVRYTSIIRAITYWNGKSFSVNPLDAVRFARQVDAARVRDIHLDPSDKVEEHMWVGPEAMTPTATPAGHP